MYFSCSKFPHCFETYVKFQSPHPLSEVHKLIIYHTTNSFPSSVLNPSLHNCLHVNLFKNSESTAKYQLYLENLCWFLFVQYGKFSLSSVNLLLLFCLCMPVISILSSPRLPGELLGKKICVILYLQAFLCHSGLKQNIARHNSSLISFFRLLGM